MKKEILIAAALSTIGLTPTVLASGSKDSEKCYGVAKKGMNDCGTKKHGCGGKSKFDNQKDEWIYLKKGICKKLAGGSLSPQKDSRVK